MASVPSPAWEIMQPLWSILLAGAAEGEDLGMVRRQDHNHAHRQCHGCKAALACGHSIHFWPPTSVSPHPIPVAQRKHLALCLAAWETRRWEPQGLVRLQDPYSSLPSPEICPWLQRCDSPLHANHFQWLCDFWAACQNCIPTCLPFFICYSKCVSFEIFIQSILASVVCPGKWSYRSRPKHISLNAEAVVFFWGSLCSDKSPAWNTTSWLTSIRCIYVSM